MFRKKFQSFLLSLILCLSWQINFAQQKLIQINWFSTQEVERAEIRDSLSNLHLSIKPFIESNVDLSRVTGFSKDSVKYYSTHLDKILHSHAFSFKTEDLFVAIDPIFDFSLGFELADTSSYSDTVKLINNTRGIQAIGDIGEKVSFQTGFYENQSYFPSYLKNFVDTNGVVPGFGRTKVFKTTGFDYSMSYGWVSFAPNKRMNFQFGHGKNFIGNGYRSLLLSDAAFNYPYIKSTFNFLEGKLQYSAIYASLQTIERLPLGEVPEALFKRKGASFNYLSWKPVPRLELGLFEGIIWERYDSTGTKRQPWGAYVPVIGLNTVLNGYGNKQKVVTGLNIRFNMTRSSYLYGQLLIDNPKKKAIGYQLGFKWFDLIIRQLDLQVEWNNVGNRTYQSHYPLQSYSHFNQPLGHPSGPATQEFLGIMNYRYHRVIAQAKYNYILHQKSVVGNWAGDPEFKYENDIAFENQRIQQFEMMVGLYLNPNTNAQLLVSWMDRISKNVNYPLGDQTLHNSVFSLVFRTNLINRYFDF
jgi:hypothetical protein